MVAVRRLVLGALPALVLTASALVCAAPAQAYTCGTVPAGQANPSPGLEPLRPAWCLGTLAAGPTTRQLDRWGGWEDGFQTNVQLGRLSNGDMGYRVFDGLSNGRAVRTRHFVNDDHWMVDMSHDNGGAAISPNQAFHFENGKLVLEADVAAGVPAYFTSQGDIVWPEVVWSTAATPTAKVTDGLYLYGHFGGQWASGCRLNGGRNMVCALEADHTIRAGNSQSPCFPAPDSRVLAVSGFQACGTTHSGFAADFGAPKSAWRQCQANQADVYCRDRFRFEWSQDGFVAYVNGIRYAQDSGWPGDARIPQSIVSGHVPVYAYFGEWGDFSDANVYRFHWGRVAVNPHDASGSLLGPSRAPSYCPGQPQDTCAASAVPAAPPAVPAGGPAPRSGSAAPAPDAPEADDLTHQFLASALNGGQQPAFWVVLGVLLACAGAAGTVRWLWLRVRRRPG
jgi:hypothetical protein